MFKTWVIWMVLTVTSPDNVQIPIALESPDRPFFQKEECEEAADLAIDEMSVELKKLGATSFGIVAACVIEDRSPSGAPL